MIETVLVFAVTAAILFGVGVGRPRKGPQLVPGQRALSFGPSGGFLPSQHAPDAAAALAAINVRARSDFTLR